MSKIISLKNHKLKNKCSAIEAIGRHEGNIQMQNGSTITLIDDDDEKIIGVSYGSSCFPAYNLGIEIK